MENNNILDKLRIEQLNKEGDKIFSSMQNLVKTILEGAESVLNAIISRGENKAILFIAMEDSEINGYPIKFLLGMEDYKNTNITKYGKSATSIVEDYMKKLDKRIETNIKKIDEDYLSVEIHWDDLSDTKKDEIEPIRLDKPVV